MVVYIVTHTKAGYDINLSKDYQLFVYTEKCDAVQTLKKLFEKSLEKSHLSDIMKQEARERFSDNLLHGKFRYQFRDVKDPEEAQYFGKIHTRTVI